LERVKLGRTGIEVSKLGIGTGTAHPSGHCAQSLMSEEELAKLLVYAKERGINFWDTALQYKTHAHVREALKYIKRQEVVIVTKLVSSRSRETTEMFHQSLRELGIDYVDVCLVHGVRTERELRNRHGALAALLDCKKAGKIRAVGISSHGLSALKAVIGMPEIDLVWARINFSGLCMDRSCLGLYDQLASFSLLKKTAKAILPQKIISGIRPTPETESVSEDDRREAEEILKVIHAQSKGVVGMKVFAEGHLGDKAGEALMYVNGLSFVDSFIVGMLNRKEIDENCRIIAGVEKLEDRE